MAVVVLAFLTPLPHAASETLRQLIGRLDDAPNILFILGVPTIMGIVVAMLKWVRHGWAYVLTCIALTAAFVTTVPFGLYMLGRNYATRSYARETGTVLLFEEGTSDTVMVLHFAHTFKTGIVHLNKPASLFVCIKKLTWFA